MNNSSNSKKKNTKNKQNSSTCRTSKEKQKKDKDILVSIILTESTSSLLKLDLPHLEDITSEKEKPTVCAIKAVHNIAETNYSKDCSCRHDEEFIDFWFSDPDNSDKKTTDCEKVSSEVAYFANADLQESTSSLQTTKDIRKKKTNDDGLSTTSSSSSDQKLKPRKVYTRPLYTIRSVAHQDNIKTQANDILVSVVNSDSSSSHEWINVCRICHGGKSIGELRAPCRCRGSIALAHIECLERWLKESANSHCELCQHHYQIIREPRYGIINSIFMFLRHPGDHFWDLLYDICGFIVYTPAAIVSTYMLMLLCESAARHSVQNDRNVTAHIMAFAAVFGLAAIDFTYSAWLMTNLQKHIIAWRSWCRNNCELRLVLSDNKVYRNSSNSLAATVE